MAYKVGRCLLQTQLNKKHMTQVELAKRMGVSKQQINKYVKNKQRMSLEVAANIAFILNCHIEDLYDWVESGTN